MVGFAVILRGLDFDLHSGVLPELLLVGLPPIPDRLPLGQTLAVPLAFWAGRRSAAALWAWHEPNPQPIRVRGHGDIPGEEYPCELQVWELQPDAGSWERDFACSGAWLEMGTPLPEPWRPGLGWVVRVGSPGPFWWGASFFHLDDGLAVVAGIAPPGVARIELRVSGGGVAGVVMPRAGYPIFILATEERPVVPVAVDGDGIDLEGDDGRPLINDDTFDAWDEFTRAPGV